MWMANDALITGMVKGIDLKDPEQRAMADALMMSALPAAPRNAGRENDRMQRTDRAVDNWPLEKIRVPTMIIHGTKDENSSYELSAKAVARIPGAKLVTLEGADHFMTVTRAAEVREHIREFASGLTQR
jgi:pimeloyl-ACP methyl ester carboxylesterase